MGGFKIYTGNRLEDLSAVFAKNLAVNPLPVFEKEHILVQNMSMKKWLANSLSGHLGIWANAEYFYPDIFLRKIFASFIPESREGNIFFRERLRWAVLEALSALPKGELSAPVENYLSGINSELKMYQLADILSSFYLKYLIFRPQMIREWVSKSTGISPHEEWQRHIWMKILEKSGDMHPVKLRDQFFEKIISGDYGKPELPSRVSAFGVSAFPSFHFETFYALSSVVEFSLYLLNPSEKYWADIRSDREISARLRTSDLSPEELHLEKGNSVLAANGRQGRDFLGMISGTDADIETVFREPETPGLLGMLQKDIYLLADRGLDDEPENGKIFFSTEETASDGSLVINICHSRLRETQVLFDYLLECFEKYPGLKAGDILVMAPDIDEYVPVIEAVFGTPESENKKIPYSISDSVQSISNEVTGLIARILQLPSSRFEYSRIMEIFENDALCEKYAFDRDALGKISHWLRQVNVRWGANPSSVSGMNFTGGGFFTWSEGIKRLLLGYMMPGGGIHSFRGIYPYDEVEGSDLELIGSLHSILSDLTAFCAEMEDASAPADWHSLLGRIIEAFTLERGKFSEGISDLKKFLLELSDAGIRYPGINHFDYRAVNAWFRGIILSRDLSGNFLDRGVSFCSMMPMRSIPMRVIALMGMGHENFPGRARRTGFDLTELRPAPGDRSIRDENRYIFLESIISARDCLFISYCGRSLKDNSEIPPSACVSELAEYMDRACGIRGGEEKISQIITREHPLHAFNPVYFSSNPFRIFSYSGEHSSAARAFLTGGGERVFADSGIDPPELPGELRLEEIMDFLKNPAAYYIKKIIGFRLGMEEYDYSDREIDPPGSLDKYKIGERIFRNILFRERLDVSPEYFLSAGLLPPGSYSAVTYRSIKSEMELLALRVQKLYGNPGEEPEKERLDIEYTVKGIKIKGRITLYNGNHLRFRPGNQRAVDLINAWVEHLLAGAAGYELPVFSAAADGIVKLDCCDAPDRFLEELIDLFIRGRKQPLPFMPELSRTYYEKIIGTRKNTDRETAFRETFKGFESRWKGGKKIDSYFNLCFSRDSILDEFCDNSEAVFRPMYGSLEKI